MARKSAKKRDKLFKKIVWFTACIAVIFIAIKVREVPFASVPLSHSSPQTLDNIAEINGYETFNVQEINTYFYYPKQQAPLSSYTQNTDALVSLESKDFLIAIYNTTEFTFRPWGTDSNVMCRYDGAAHTFVDDTDQACSFEPLINDTQPHLYRSFERENKVQYVALLPFHNRQHFMVLQNIHTRQDNCAAIPDVCEQRQLKDQNKLQEFAKDMLQKNHNLFTHP